jgi:hypothetical protein
VRLEPRDWLLFLLALEDAALALDPVRIQKGLFLLSREAPVELGEVYQFAPYDYGPFASEIYVDVARLVEDGLAIGEEVPGYTWRRYRATPSGLRRAQELVAHLTPQQQEALRYLHAAKRDVLPRSFQQLLHYVYSRYPEFRERSVFNG